MRRSCKVAVIGAGVSGLVAARELLREGHEVVVFEKSGRVGGTWAYDPRSDSDPVGLDPARRAVHGSLYASLRTNLPRPLMGFSDYPLLGRSFGDARAFPGHEEMLALLEAFAGDAGVPAAVRARTEAARVFPRLGGGGGGGAGEEEWVVEWRRREEEDGEVVEEGAEEFDAVVVCNGHHTEPRVPRIPGIERWPGKQIHSHNYRIPEPFRDQIVVIIGMGSSAQDISKEISHVAKEIHLASRSTDVIIGKLDGHDNIWQHSMVSCVHEDGVVDFDDGSSLCADVIFYCTGYKYHFPFLELDEINIDDSRVGPLYKHIFPPKLAPWLSFVGLPYKAIIFLMIELQCKWIARILSNELALPSETDMMASVLEHYRRMEEAGMPKHHTHSLLSNQADYLNWLSCEVGMPPVEEWRFRMYDRAIMRIHSRDDKCRDNWDADPSI
ncbi:Flavin-containing monooxygenase FMO GS-OX-like 3 [Ananas comosus]|uniref:Flavin-containing monooxygenase n=1 Tax=Ananas comosus TaxID=4615 RepID=A0A199UI23_ANACO|nr:Flavin-containing monooxygenase FMO GS-OX-like 3 [Ananas comosus]